MGDAAPKLDEIAPDGFPAAPVWTHTMLAALLHVNERTVRERARCGEIPGAFKIGDLWRFKRCVVVAWLTREEPVRKGRRQ